MDKVIDPWTHRSDISHELGMRASVFIELVKELQATGMTDSQYVMTEEKAAIFLYMSVAGLRFQHVGKQFQRSNEFISKYITARW
jgi:glycosylphosphatidylinositol transamidase (GPIT) subunit GPI8